jgi:anaerobic selenocysteine-containing dehydrogenase
MDRRDFIKLTAITGTSATLASCGNPEHQLIRFVPDEDLVPGVAEWKPSVCPACSAGCAVNVRVMEADVETVRNGQAGIVKMGVAKKLEGLPKDPINQGSLCARGQASIQITYHPDRLTQPMKRSGARGSGDYTPVSWDQGVAELVGKLDALAAAREHGTLRYLMRARHGQRRALADAFLSKFGAPAPVTFDLFADDVLREANAISFSKGQLPTIDLARSRFVISFGADLLGTWNSPVAQSVAYGEMRQGRVQVRGKLVQVEARMSLTGANADEWVPVKPGTEGVLALGLAHAIVAAKLLPASNGRASAAIEGWSAGLPDYTPARVEQLTGVAAKRVERIARELVEFRPAVAVAGGPPLAHTNGLFHALAVNALNELLGAVGQPGGMYFTPGVSVAQPSAPSLQSLQDLASAKVVLLDAANPVYGAPKALKVREALEKVPFIASFGSFVDDTSALADLILPDHSFLESWVESRPESGSIEAVSRVFGPAMKPLHQSRAIADVLIDVAGKLKSPIALPWKNAEELAKSTMSVGNGLQAVPNRADASPRDGLKAVPYTYAAATFDGEPSQYPFHFLPYLSQQFGDGSVAHLPWLQEMPDPLTSAMWSSWIEINPQTAERLGIANGDLVDVTSSQGMVRAPAMIFPGIAPDMVAMPVGQGHENFTRTASGRGANPIGILAPVTTDAGHIAWAATRVKIARAGGANGTLIMFAGELREHPGEGKTR